MSIFDSLQIPTNSLDIFIRSVEISAYIPGRVRLHSRNLVDNPGLEQQVRTQLGAFAEIDKVETSTVTGSILIQYQPERLRRNAELCKVEQYIMTHARRK
ncbi:hypothetical protein FZ041_11845 [Selenomonas caprae]|uniref:Uncharacterized protein n=2 Tax=Selenomonas TaxID=970 RepID=A0A1I3HC04_SELRU|nr:MULTISPECIES: hypothetical protein [Selenomonas]TYZ27272.1 hypothetical protein FZ041_11845 [Selenomonas caprae]SFI33182.1 hypothetical protein SAMN04487861_1295 [Selenomonas ruminantium]